MTTNPEIIRNIDVAVFTGAPGHNVYKTVAKLLELPFEFNIHIIAHRPPRRFRQLARNQFRNVGKHGWRWIPYQFAETLSWLAAKYFSHPNVRTTGQRYTLKSLKDNGHVCVKYFASINSPAAQAYLAALPNLQLGLSLAAPILASGTFELPKLGTINLHKGKLPEFRGMPPAFWELLSGESHVGVSVHYVEKGLDTGPIIKSCAVPIEQFSSPAGLRVALDELGHKLVCSATSDILDGNNTPVPQGCRGTTNSRPTLKLERKMAEDISRKEGTHGVVHLLKKSVFNSFSVTRHLGTRCGLVKPTITILLYHRVSDAFRDSVTIGIERFDKQLEYLKNNYEVCTLRSLVNGNLPTENGRTIVCITFDDGYLDNYQNAAPLLVKHGLPATFFISTDNVTNQTPFQHDLDKLGFGLPNMTWDNIREMDQEGFDFGSHTVNHADLGSIPENLIVDELLESKQTIETELNYNEVLFAFPFGQRHNFSERARDIVKEIGYKCCCSAYGGQNTAEKWDPFRIKRIGINYNFSIAALRARIHGWKDA